MGRSVVDRVGEAGLAGWRQRVADTVAGPVSQRTPLEADRVRALVGLAFLVLAVLYVVRALGEAQRAVRDAD
ncbi:MAG: hypothetical protein R3C15_15900 [Thermoleophilia bacterium]